MFLMDDDLEETKKQAMQEFTTVLDDLKADYPEMVEGVAAGVGGSLGAGASFTALYFGGSVVGLSAAGVTSGLAAAGGLVGGGMVAGMGVLTAPVALTAVAGYALVRRRRSAKRAVALGTAIEKLYRIQERLAANAEYFRQELAEINAYIDTFENKVA